MAKRLHSPTDSSASRKRFSQFQHSPSAGKQDTEAIKLLLVTGAAGKVGQHFIDRFLASDEFAHAKVRAFCHNRLLEESKRLEVIEGNMSDRQHVARAMEGVSHVIHLATSKESPDSIMDVAIKGMFWLLETCRNSPSFRQFIFVGGDAGMGHFFYPHSVPVTEEQERSAYPGCYALSKVLEEVMLEQYYVQYDFAGCCLRAPWIMEKDDFKYTLSFGDDVFGGPVWKDFVSAQQAKELQAQQTVPVMLDPNGVPVQRNFVHVDDLCSALLLALGNTAAHQQLFNICMDEPVHYRRVAEYLHRTRGLPSIDITTSYHSTWLDNTKAKFILGWRPQYNLSRLIEESWGYQRAADDPRKIWYPG